MAHRGPTLSLLWSQPLLNKIMHQHRTGFLHWTKLKWFLSSLKHFVSNFCCLNVWIKPMDLWYGGICVWWLNLISPPSIAIDSNSSMTPLGLTVLGTIDTLDSYVIIRFELVLVLCTWTAFKSNNHRILGVYLVLMPLIFWQDLESSFLTNG